MGRLKHIHLALTLAGLFYALPSWGTSIEEYYQAYADYLRTGSAAAKSRMDDFRWPAKINGLDSLLNGSKFLTLLKERGSQPISNAKLAYGLEALGKLFKAADLGAPSDNPALKGVQVQYRQMRSEAIEVLKEAYLDPPSSRDQNHFDGTIAEALKALGEKLPEKRENPAGNVPVKAAPLWLRVKELSGRLANALPAGADPANLGKELTQLLDSALALKIPREERFKVAKDLLESWKLPGRWPLVAETGALVGKLIGKDGGVEKFGTGAESDLKESFTQFFTDHLDNPDKIPFANRFAVLDIADGQLEQLSAARHPLVRFVYLAERAGSMSASGRTPWMERAKALVPSLNSLPLRPMERFPLAEKLVAAIESDSRLDSKEGAPDQAKTFLYPDLEVLAVGLNSLLSTEEVKRAETMSTQGVDQAKIRSSAESVLTRMAEMQRANTQFQTAVVKSLEAIGGVPIYDADSFLGALQELVDLEREGSSSSYTRRRKLEKALVASKVKPYFKSLGAPERNRHLDRLTTLMASDSKVALPIAFHAVEELGKIESKRRISMPEALIARLKEISGMDSRTSESLELLKEQAAATLTLIGYQPVIEITSASQYLDAVKKVGEHEGPPTEATKAMEAAIERFDLKKLEQNMNPAERSKALAKVLPILNGSSKWAKAKALAATTKLMGKSKLRESETQPIRDRIWELTSLGPNANVVDKEMRLKAISALEGLGEKPVNNLREWVEALELAHADTLGFQRVVAERLRAVDLYSLEQGLSKSTPSDIRVLLSKLSAIIQDPKGSFAVRSRALDAFGEASASEVRRGAGVPRSGFNAVRLIAADETLSPILRKAAEQALSRLGVFSAGAISDLLELELTEDRAKAPLENVLEGLSAQESAQVLKSLGSLEAWSLQEFAEEAGVVKSRRTADLFARLLKSDDLRVRRASLRQVWRWSRDAKSLPPWLADNQAFQEAIVSRLGDRTAEERAMAVDVVGNRLSEAKIVSPGLVSSVQAVIRSGESSEDTRFVAAKALLRNALLDPSSPDAPQRQRDLRVAFAKAPERRKHQYAELLLSLAKNGAPRPADPALLAAEWLQSSLDSAGEVSPAKLSALVRQGVESNDLAKAKRSWGALNWLASEPESGRERPLPGDSEIIGLPNWFKAEPSLLAAILGQLVNKDPTLREEAVAFLRSRRPAEQMEHSESLRLAAWGPLSQANRFASSSPLLAAFLRPSASAAPARKNFWTSAEAHEALRAATALSPQFHPQAASQIVRAFSELEGILFEDGPGQIRREAIAKDILELVQALETYGTSATIPAAFSAAKLTWRGSGKSEIPKEVTDSLVKVFRGFARQSDENELQLPRYAREALQAMGRREKVLAAGDPLLQRRVERPSLVGILGRLMSDFPEVQDEAVRDLGIWRMVRPGESTFQQELTQWGKEGGPDFDAIVARILAEPKNGEEPFASPALRSALASELVELVKPRSDTPNFQPGLPGAESTSRVMAQFLFSEDAQLRELAQEWVRRFRPPEEGADPFLPNLLAEALQDPKKRARALQILSSLMPSEISRRQAPAWILSSTPIQKSLLDLVAELPRSQKEEPAELLLSKLGKALTLEAGGRVRNMEKVDGVYHLKLTPKQIERTELVNTALKIVDSGDVFGKIAAMEYLALVKVPDSRITQKLFEVAKDLKVPAELRAHALEALSKRNIRWDYNVRSPEVDALVGWTWDRFINEKDPDIRTEAARFIFSHTGLIRQMPSPSQSVPIKGKVESTAHGIRIGLRELEKITAGNPLPDAWKTAARTAYDEVFLGTHGERLPSIESFNRERPAGRSPSREEICAFAAALLGKKQPR